MRRPGTAFRHAAAWKPVRGARRARLAAAVVVVVSTFAGVGSPVTPALGSVAAPGYRLLSGDGGVFSFGRARFEGSAASDPADCPANPPGRLLPEGSCSSIASTSGAGGYWILNRATGRVFAFGDAGSFGEPADEFGGVPGDLVPAFEAIVPTPTDQGYWVLALQLSGAATVMPFGDAESLGDSQSIVSRTGQAFDGTPVALAATPSGNGYWEVHSDGGVFAFGDARFYGSMGGRNLSRPVVGIAATADGRGYWLVASDGGVFAFGDARFGGSMAGRAEAPVVGIARNPDGPGYWLASSDGGVFALGGAPFLGSMGATPLAQPVVAVVSNPGTA